jgi:hypothetical protein
MFRRVLIGTALAVGLAFGIPTTTFAQPPSPPEVVQKVGEGVKRVVKKTDRAIRRAGHRTNRVVRKNTHRVTRRTVRAMCNDGRVHTGRTRATACANHGGFRG